MAVLAQTEVQRAPDPASGRPNRRCSDKSTRTRQAPCDTFPVSFPSFQQLVSPRLPELTGLSLNLISPDGFVSHDRVPVAPRARADSQHPLCPSASRSEHRRPHSGCWKRLKKGPDPGLLKPKIYIKNSTAWAKRWLEAVLDPYPLEILVFSQQINSSYMLAGCRR